MTIKYNKCFSKKRIPNLYLGLWLLDKVFLLDTVLALLARLCSVSGGLTLQLLLTKLHHVASAGAKMKCFNLNNICEISSTGV